MPLRSPCLAARGSSRIPKKEGAVKEKESVLLPILYILDLS